MEPTTTSEAPEDDAFTIRHCTEWAESAGIDLAYVPAMVAELAERGPESTSSWPDVARFIGARFTDGYEYR